MSAAAPIRLLLVDDNEDDRTLVRRELARAYPQLQVTEIRKEKEFQDALKNNTADYVPKAPAHFVRLPAAVAAALERRFFYCTNLAVFI